MRTARLLTLATIAAACLAAAPTTAPSSSAGGLDDTFDDGKPAELKGRPVWTVRGGDPKSIAAERDGTLILTCDGPAEYVNRHLVAAPRPELNFAARGPVTLTFEGLAFGGTAPATSQVMRLSLVTGGPANATEYLSTGGVGLAVHGTGRVRLGYKVDTPDRDPDGGHILFDKSFDRPPESADVRLDATGYELTLRFADARAPVTHKAKWADMGPGLTAAALGGDAGPSLVLLGQRSKAPAETVATVTLGRVAAVPAKK